jgi:nicotinamide mononucleotide transporter
MDINLPVSFGYFQSTLPELVAVAAGLLSVWFMKKERIVAFPLGIVNVLIYVYIFFITKLYANAAINAYFFFMSVYGWYNWSRKVNHETKVKISRSSPVALGINLVAIVVLFLIIRIILVRYTESCSPVWDAFTTAVYMVAQWLLSRKKIENWLLWIGADLIMVAICISQGLPFTALQYFIFTIIATFGFIEWKTKLRK